MGRANFDNFHSSRTPNHDPIMLLESGKEYFQPHQANTILAAAKNFIITYSQAREEHVMQDKQSGEVMFGSKDRSEVVSFYQDQLKEVIRVGNLDNKTGNANHFTKRKREKARKEPAQV